MAAAPRRTKVKVVKVMARTNRNHELWDGASTMAVLGQLVV